MGNCYSREQGETKKSKTRSSQWISCCDSRVPSSVQETSDVEESGIESSELVGSSAADDGFRGKFSGAIESTGLLMLPNVMLNEISKSLEPADRRQLSQTCGRLHHLVREEGGLRYRKRVRCIMIAQFSPCLLLCFNSREGGLARSTLRILPYAYDGSPCLDAENNLWRDVTAHEGEEVWVRARRGQSVVERTLEILKEALPHFEASFLNYKSTTGHFDASIALGIMKLQHQVTALLWSNEAANVTPFLEMVTNFLNTISDEDAVNDHHRILVTAIRGDEPTLEQLAASAWALYQTVRQMVNERRVRGNVSYRVSPTGESEIWMFLQVRNVFQLGTGFTYEGRR